MKNSASVIHPLLYTSFDRVPAPKGASTHIAANARAVGERFGSLVLATPGPRDEPIADFATGVRQLVLGCPDPDVLGRVMTFRAKLSALLKKQVFDLIHFRSIFEGYPVATMRERLGSRLLYEVNGLPSIELPYAYPGLRGDALLTTRLKYQEDSCLQAADRVVTVSEVNRRYLVERGVDPAKITVIPNGVDLDLFPYQDPANPQNTPLRLLYCGTLSAWQGVEVLLEAMPLVLTHVPVQLSLVGPVPRTRHDELMRLIRRRGMAHCVTFHGPQSQARVVEMLHEHHASIVPLSAVQRNTVQGCCPLKLLEAAAAGCPVVASDLPVIRELFTPEEHFLPTPPDDPASLALAIWRIAESPPESRARTRRARGRVENRWTWKRGTSQLLSLYEELLAMPPSSAARLASSTSVE